MRDTECVALLRAWAPRLGLRWKGFTNVRRQVCRRIAARIGELGLSGSASYAALLERDPAEQRVLYRLCYVTISRLYRDRRTYDALRDAVLPTLAARVLDQAAAEDRCVRVWSAGCASGEEPYSVAIVWHLDVAARFPGVRLRVLATDFDAAVLERAARAEFRPSSLVEAPAHWRDAAFVRHGPAFCVRDELRGDVTFALADIRSFLPEAPSHLVLARNSVFTYFDPPSQQDFVRRVASHLEPEGYLVIGAEEQLPPESGEQPAFSACPEAPGIHRLVPR